MTSRERTLQSLSHRQPDRVPTCLAYEDPRKIAERYGEAFDASLMRQDIYGASIDLGEPHPEIREKYLRDIPEDARVDPWGVATWRSSTKDTFAVYGPLQEMTRPGDLDDFPFPDVPDAPPGYLVDRVDSLHRDGFAVQGLLSQTIFELSWNMYGMECLLVSFTENAAFAHRLFNEITERKRSMARCLVESGVDVLRLGDDVGTQHGMMISPAQWREFLKPRLASIIETARSIRPDIEVFYHSDGDVREIIDELIEVGVTILNPVQPECMDPFEIKERYGDRLTLWGTVGTQSLLPFGTPEEIRRTVGEYVRILGAEGGYVVSPTHSINRDVPWENIVAYYHAIQ